MDVDSFQKFPLSHLDFNGESKSEPQSHNFDVRKLSSFETLLEQNEETLTKLKISLRKQARLEEEALKYQNESQRLNELNQSLKDKNYVLSENETLWKSQISQLEETLQTLHEKLTAYSSQNTRYKSEIQRHQKYQEKIKTQVRPYLHQLKEYSHSLEAQIEKNERQLVHKDTQIRELRQQISELSKNTKLQIETLEKQHHDAIESYESQIGKVNTELANIKIEAEGLVLKNFKLQKSFERQVDLENELIELSRSKDTLKAQLESEIVRIQEKNNELSRDNKKLQFEHADLKERVLSDADQIRILEKNQYDLQHQLESLRYIWNAKNDENEKLKLAIQALEKLNLDLSLKVQELRSGSNTTGAISKTVDSEVKV